MDSGTETELIDPPGLAEEGRVRPLKAPFDPPGVNDPPPPPAPPAPDPEEAEGPGPSFGRSKGEVSDFLWPEEPPRLVTESVNSLIMHCVGLDASDISFQSDRPATVEVHGTLHAATRRSLDSADLATLLTKIYGPDALAKLAGGNDLDLSYEIRPSRYHRVRFRVNCTAILSHGRDAVQITMRVLPDKPPKFEDLGIEKEIMGAWSPRQGLVLVTGPTGSGKSTLLAAGCRMLIEREQGCGKMLTYEAPIEYVYDDLLNERSLVSQSEIPRHLPTFAAGVRNALRRKPAIILVGESRDRETVSAAIEAAQTGHCVYSTVHTIGVAATIRRMVSVFEPEERVERAYALMETLRLVVTQTLVPRIGGGRVGVREWMAFSDDIRELMLDMDHERWTLEIQRLVPERGQPMQRSAQELFDANLIDKRWFLLLSQSVKTGSL